MSDHVQLIYCSRPFGFTEAALDEILEVSRRRNRRDGITGSLVCRHDLYLQLLEGTDDAVTGAFERISRDDRHADIRKLWHGRAVGRLFPGWDMRHDPVRPWMWTSDDIAGGALERAGPLKLVAFFARVASEPHELGKFN